MSIRVNDVPNAPGGFDLTGKKLMVHDLSAPLNSNTKLINVTDLISEIGLPVQTNNGGKYLTTNGSVLSWGTITIPSLNDLLPSQSANAGKFLTTNGSNASWSNITFPLQDINAILPSQTGNAGKYLITNGNIASWSIIPSLSDGDKGDITLQGSGTVWRINNNAVTLAKMQTIGSRKILGNATVANGTVQELFTGQGLSFQNNNEIFVANNTTVQKTEFYVNNVLAGTRKALNLVVNNMAYGFLDNSTSDRFDFFLTGNSTSLSVSKNGSYVYSQPAINLIEGTNVNLVIANNNAQNRIDVTINAAPNTTVPNLQEVLISGGNLTVNNNITSLTGKTLNISSGIVGNDGSSELILKPTDYIFTNYFTAGVTQIIANSGGVSMLNQVNNIVAAAQISSGDINLSYLDTIANTQSTIGVGVLGMYFLSDEGQYFFPRNAPNTGQILVANAGQLEWQDAVSVADTNAWHKDGDSGTDSAINFIGTTDNVDLIFKRNNLFAGLLSENNTSFGVGALSNTPTGNNNTALGYIALELLTSGQYNVSIGSNSMTTLTTGSKNVTVGADSQGITTGDNNTILGYLVGANLTTGSRNILIGSEIDAPSATDDGQLNIQNIIFGTGNINTGSTISTGNIGIGVILPSEKLEVNGNIRFSGALMPNNNSGTLGQVLTSGGVGFTPTWETIAPGAETLQQVLTNGAVLTTANIINTGAFGLSFTASGATGISINNSSTGTGLYIQTTAGTGLISLATTGLGGIIAVSPVSTNTTVSVLQVTRLSATTPATNMAGSLDFSMNTNGSAGLAVISHQLISKWTTATNASRSSQFEINGVNNAITSRQLAITSAGKLILDKYGIGTHTGTATRMLAVDSVGNVIETAIPSAVDVTAWHITGNAGTTAGTNFIGTTDSQSLVFKVGNIYAGNISATTNSTSYGLNALNLTETGGSNHAFGKDSLHLVTSGTGNSALGGALSILTTGSFNSAMGNGAGSSLITGSNNTLFGAATNVATSSTSNGTAIGYQAVAAANQIAFAPAATQFKVTGFATGAGYVLTDVLGNGILTLAAPSVLAGTYQLLSEKNAINGYAGLDASGKISPSVLPSVTVTNTYVVASQAAMLASGASVGDIAVRTDTSTTYVLQTLPASTLGNWVQLLFPGVAVTSVFGRTGAVVAQTGDYTFAQISSTPTTIAGYGITDYNSLWDTRLSGKTTSNLPEGTNLYYTDARAIAAQLTGYTSGAGTVTSSDTILQAIQKLNGNISAIGSGVTSIFGRTGVVTAQTGDYTFAQISSTPTTIAGYGITDFTSLWNTNFSSKTTSNLPEGSNLYFTNGRVQALTDTLYSVLSHTHTFASLTSKPTTIAGYGITDYNSLWDTRLGTKTTANLTEGSNLYYTNARGIGSVLTGYVSGAGTVSATDTILQAIQKLNGNILAAAGVTSVFGRIGAVTAQSGDYAFSQLAAKPTTLFGYGITDAQPLDGDLTAIAALAGTTGSLIKTALNTWALDTNSYALSSHTHSFASLTGIPTTIAGYGITDAVTPISVTAFTNKSGNISMWTNDSGYITATSVTTLTNKSGNISQWTNDSGYQLDIISSNRRTVNYTLVLSDKNKLVDMNVSAANNVTVPLNSSVAFPIGTQITISQYGTGQTTIVAASGVTIRSALGALKLTAQYSGAVLTKIGTDEWYLFGDITV